MNVSMTLESSLLETFGAIGSFSLSQMIWSKYEKFAVPKIEAGTVSLRGTMSYFNGVSEAEARKIVDILDPLIETLTSMEPLISEIDEEEYMRFKSAALEYFATLKQAQELLFESAYPHYSYQISQKVLAEDWDTSENEIWDNY